IGGTDMGEALVAAAEVEEMMDTFFADYGPLFSSGDHEAAKANPELFISLIDRAIRHFTQEAEEESSI
ncbi:MAG: hypothetical protein N2Z74_08195, partial [Syntrophales bacterium]|nr:hypothetical protein [Syntrophales bacterium]